ncbi:MarR family winged helix-turn-helix transcriptional regulator [Adhaeribacter aquaticus]|uniref:MarR family winged helix-turn-helix transcriptional regulator n=1 Tax=Adhaeribacter aquaticus TaxID=299567 RepID=UPI000400222C|nr:MarR family transcriptional regulator [Adhaeribacter aquaticus]
MEKLLIRNQLCFKFYAFSRHITTLYKPLLAELGLTYPQYLVMLVLWEKEQTTVKVLGEQLMLDSGTLTPLLKRLAQKGLLNRSRSTTDERVVEISLTTEGRKIKQKASCIPDQLMQAVNTESSDLPQLHAILSKMIDQIQE